MSYGIQWKVKPLFFLVTPLIRISSIRDSTGGFSWVLSGLKAYMEHDIELNLIADRYPKELGSH